MAIIRWVLGRLILLLNAIFRPKALKRSPEEQALMDRYTASLALYQYEACPFCVKVRRAMRRQSLNIELRDAKRNEAYKNELLSGGGQLKVPCLRIEETEGDVKWMYESSDIIRYLEQRYANAPA